MQNATAVRPWILENFMTVSSFFMQMNQEKDKEMPEFVPDYTLIAPKS
jgi:hypothetical protein